MSKSITVNYENRPGYTIQIETDYSKLVPSIFNAGIKKTSKLCVITDSNVRLLHADLLLQVLSQEFEQVSIFEISAGEVNKTLDTVQNIYEFLILHNFDRSDCLLAFGGGVVGDLTGYAAATYLRGISFIQIPTTLLAQVDSSIGGKTGVDFLSYKNMVGAFHMPAAVYMNLTLLNTLPEIQFISGMGEIIKHGLIRDVVYYNWLASHMTDIIKKDQMVLEEMIFQSCNIKKEVVELDPTEKGERALLNFGHTIGHAVEKLSEFSLPHGQCVALGMRSALYLSNKYGTFSDQDLNKALELLDHFKFPSSVANLSAEDILFATKSDKKMKQGKIKFILLEAPGKAYMDSDLSDLQLLESINYIIEDIS